MDDLEKRFNKAVPQLQAIINKRRNSWQATSIMEWDDVSSILLTRIYQKFNLYDQTQPLDRWANTLISNAINNLLRDKIWKIARPCIAATSYGNPCAFCLPNDKCSWTKSGLQDDSCRYFKNWLKKKQVKHAIASPVSIENHLNESHGTYSDFIDIEGAKKVIDEKIISKLNREEVKIYKLVYIRHLELEEAGEKMGYKKQKNSPIPGYLVMKAALVKIRELARVIIEEEGLVR